MEDDEKSRYRNQRNRGNNRARGYSVDPPTRQNARVNQDEGPFFRGGAVWNNQNLNNVRNRGISQRGKANGQSHSRNKNLNMENHQRYRADNGAEGSSGEHPQEHRFQRQQNSKNRIIGFKSLEELAQSATNEILEKLNEKKNSFINLVSSNLENCDMIVLIVEVLAKLSLSSFDELKFKWISEISNSLFLSSLRNYLLELPYVQVKSKNNLYWRDQNKFWDNLIIFCESVFNLSPNFALQKCRILIESVTKCCLDELENRHGYTMPDDCNLKLKELRERISQLEKKTAEEKCRKMERGSDVKVQMAEPPENFRELSLTPLREELVEGLPFLRANIVNGGYRDIEHYLDVQFRLLREDCFGPLREGIQQLLNNPDRKKYDNIRVYKNVRFVEPYVNKSKMGVVIQLDEGTIKKQSKINWSHSNRFTFGSLLLFTKDNWKSFIIATILDRDVKFLQKGKIPIEITNDDIITKVDLKIQESYVMIESEVYYEPYLHVLKALQDPTFPKHLAMSKYIVQVDPEPRYPLYLAEDSTVSVNAMDQRFHFDVLKPTTWPSNSDLGLNESQFEAYKLALTNEFAVIQGPPGTGKTFLGIQLAKTLLENFSNSNSSFMLVICYTNHALDQFLEHLLLITKSIVRIGGRSRSPAMKNISLNELRSSFNDPRKGHHRSLFLEERHNLHRHISKLKAVQTLIESLRDGVLMYGNILEFIPEVNILERCNNNLNGKDVIELWLFDYMPHITLSQDQFDYLLNECNDNATREDLENEEETSRTTIVLDDFDVYDDSSSSKVIDISSSFMLHDAEIKLRRLILQTGKSEYKHKRKLWKEINYLVSQISLFKNMKHMYGTNNEVCNFRNGENLREMPLEQRWSLYFSWANRAIKKFYEVIKPLQKKIISAANAHEEARMLYDLKVIQGKKVIGMTTSGAARLRKMLQTLAPPVVIVEEAAEVLEQHIITSLTASCKHLILIGDHQQLRPSASYMKLARNYNIEVSLFERMIMNNIHSRRLSVQHRMRPEIAALISPHIYIDLLNHSSVESFPQVRGVTANIFFYTHNYKEKAMNDSSSRSNEEEANMVLASANYLIQQDYEPSEVTILAAYAGQMFYMMKKRMEYALLTNVKITVVDNYQGEESKIILLSLVRNNSENKIGFLGTANRICVALSRAREGLYLFGNIEILTANSPLWSKIAKTLEENGSVGPEIRLRCESHPSQITTIKTLEDYEKVPEGGCLLKCNANLPACGHACPLMCHGYDRNHVKIRCTQKCERVLCDLGHVCPGDCWIPCGLCLTPVKKTFPCGHTLTKPCHIDPMDPAFKCHKPVDVRLDLCGHQVEKPCYKNVKNVKCIVKCEYRIEKCGHQCQRNCHLDDDPEHEKYVCEKPCAKVKNGCTFNLDDVLGPHQCLKICYQTCDDCNVKVLKKRSTCKHKMLVPCSIDVNETPCLQKCSRALECGHHCLKKCSDPCGDCKQMVEKKLPSCNHTIMTVCKTIVTRVMCKETCERKLSCGHQCTAPCVELCGASRCTQPSGLLLDAPCGHKVQPPCYLMELKRNDLSLNIDKTLLKHCREPCGMTLQCDHRCSGTCGACHQGRLHVACSQPCDADFICGHRCEEPCNQLCPPCKKPCEVKCQHSKCSKLCGQLCVTCKEKCSRNCTHGKCDRFCGAACSRDPCSQRCPRRLPCTHQCHGLCGEPCPDICKICRPDDFPKDFLGDDFEEDVTFIKLQDCPHVLSVEDADNLMNGDEETIKIRSCPYCRKPIINTYRYKDLVNNIYKSQINPIKERIYGRNAQIDARLSELVEALHNIKKANVIALENKYFSKAADKMINIVKKEGKKKISLLQIEMHFVYVTILNLLGDNYNKFMKSTSKILEEEYMDNMKMICQVLMKNIQKLSQQQQTDIGREIKRMSSIIQLSAILSKITSSKHLPEVIKVAENAKSIVLSWSTYDEEKYFIALKELMETTEIKEIEIKKERELIVKAIGLKQGHWFKCPNGHIYCIGECGGAMETSNCPECKEKIGGTNHTLLGNNALASEMDAAQHAAWSDTANNMVNFDL